MSDRNAEKIFKQSYIEWKLIKENQWGCNYDAMSFEYFEGELIFIHPVDDRVDGFILPCWPRKADMIVRDFIMKKSYGD